MEHRKSINNKEKHKKWNRKKTMNFNTDFLCFAKYVNDFFPN